MTERAYGDKYEAGLSTPEIAKKLRQDIKAAVKAGELPKGLKVSVRSESFSGGSAIRLRVTAVPDGFTIYNPEWVAAEDKREPHHLPWASPEADKVARVVEGLAAAYNYDGSDTMTDYFDVNFYGGHLVWDHKLEEADKARTRARLAGEPEPDTSEPEFGPKAVLALLERSTWWVNWSASQVARELHVSVDRARKQLDYLVNGCSLEAGWNPTRRAKVYRLPKGDMTAEEIAAASAYANEQAAQAKAQAKATRDANKKARAEYEARREAETAELRAQAAAKKEALAETRTYKVEGAKVVVQPGRPSKRTFNLNGPVFVVPKYGVC